MALGTPDLSKFRRCVNFGCTARKLCEMPNGQLEDVEYGLSGDCDYFYPIADLRGENIRGNPTGRETFDPERFKTKRVKRRRFW